MKVRDDRTRISVPQRPVRLTRWWWAVLAIPPLFAVLATVVAPNPRGHWTEHLSGGTLKSTQLLLLVGLVAILGCHGASARGRTLSPLLLIALAVIGIGIVFQVFGDFQVADSIWRTSGDPGFGDGYDQGHDNSAFGDLIVIVGGLAFVVIAAISHRVSIWLAIVAAVLMIIPPPFFWPAVGVMMLVLYWLTVDRRPREALAR